MTTTETTDLTTKAIDFINTLRDVADFLADRPTLADAVAVGGLRLYAYAGTAAEFGRLVAEFGDGAKEADDDWLKLTRVLGPITIQVFAPKSATCERVVVGQRTVQREVYPDDVRPQIVEDVEDVVEWRCPPSFLALAGESEGGES